MSYQIFISYRRDGGDMLAQLLFDRLTHLGFSVFYDVESLRSGKFNEALYNYRKAWDWWDKWILQNV